MTKQKFKEKLQNEMLIMDGAMGTMLQPHVPTDKPSEYANLNCPEILSDIHKQYIDAGADIINTNSFGGSRLKLSAFGMEAETQKINIEAAKIAKAASNSKAIVAGNIGPTGKLVEPMGELLFDKAFDVFQEQAKALEEGGCDIYSLETFSDLKELKIAIMAIQSISDLPIMAAMTFEEDFKTFTGTDPETAANVLSSLGVDVIGINCSTGPEPMLEVVGRYVMQTDTPVFVEPNAGIPSLSEEGATYQITPEEMGSAAEKFYQIGVNIMGSCCGSTPEYTRKLKEALSGKTPLHRNVLSVLSLSSRSQTITLGSDSPFAVVGERINPTNREDLNEALKNKSYSVLQNEAKTETDEGAHVLDVNIGSPDIDEAAIMGGVIRSIENVSRLPICVDSSNPDAIEAALKESPGKVLINSVHGSEESMSTVLPLAAKYGAGLICLAVGEKGIPKTAEARVDVIKTIVKRAEALGIPRSHLICDCLTLTVSAQQKRAQSTLDAIRIVKEELGLPTILGVSNISFGLPERSLINATFLSMAMSAGLDAAIMNPGDKRMMETVRAASVLTVRDKDSKSFVASHAKKKKKKSKGPEIEISKENTVYQAVISGNRDEITTLVQKTLDEGTSALDINNTMLIPAIQEVGLQYDKKEIFLPQMILAAETMQNGFSVLEPHFSQGDVSSKGKILLCTVKGDVHDIGKNIVGLFLKNQGYEVIDLGKDVSVDQVLDETAKYNPDIIGLSALMTTTMTEMPKIIDALKSANLDKPVIVGGAVVTKQYASSIGASGYAKDGVTAVKLADSILKPIEG